MEPGVDYEWEGKLVVAVICHAVNHWMFYSKVQDVWYCQDSAVSSVWRANPFHLQSDRQTIDMICFK